MADLDPSQLVDRDTEQAIFRQLLMFEDDARLLTIQDRAGSGKSALLRRLQYNCRWELQVPAAYVPLERFVAGDGLELCARIKEELASLDVPFPSYDQTNEARILQPSGGFWSASQEAAARRTAVGAFLADLKEFASSRPLVVLLDAFEAAPSSLQDWLIPEFITPLCLAPDRPDRLVVVLAGQRLPNFEATLPPSDQKRLVRLERLRWDPAHLAPLLAVHGFTSLDSNELAWLSVKFAQGGASLRDTLALAEVLSKAGGTGSGSAEM